MFANSAFFVFGALRVSEQKYDKNVYPSKPQFSYIKVGCIKGGVFLMKLSFIMMRLTEWESESIVM